MTDRIKCRYCRYEVPLWRRKSGGEAVSGWARLLRHVERRHRDEFLVEQAKQQPRQSVIEQLIE